MSNSTSVSAHASGQFNVGGDITINRLGFGAMRIVGPNALGEPSDLAAVRETLARLPELGVNFIDTADSYGPHISEELIREALHPYNGALIATKGGLVRPGVTQGTWPALGRPDYLRQCVITSLRRLGVERIDLWQLHRIDTSVPMDEQFGVIAEMQKEGLIRHAGLSEVSVDQIKAAQKHSTVTTVQNLYNLGNRKSEDVLNYCESNNIGFIPWYPLAAGELTKPGSVLSKTAEKLNATPGQIALAWLLKRSPVMLPIPGTSKVNHLIDNVAAADFVLSDEDFAALSKLA
ncbi:aldo/keto reductase [Cedecea neteri]|uniref:aldo/keto reductase n=1 Tax=Cedecea neteri TaxID=158822 RepID=UPI002AA67E2D|nr:aldo/keto reductase [Cedecea neteri]WPU21939.1 aldo/keto reductase [Cedecea neteri]